MDEEPRRGDLIHFVCINPDHVGSGGRGYSTVHAAVWAWCPSPQVVEDHDWSAVQTPIEIGEARHASRTANLRGKVPDSAQESTRTTLGSPADASVPGEDHTVKGEPARKAAPAASGREGDGKIKPKRRR